MLSDVGLEDVDALALAELSAILAQLLSHDQECLLRHAVTTELLCDSGEFIVVDEPVSVFICKVKVGIDEERVPWVLERALDAVTQILKSSPILRVLILSDAIPDSMGGKPILLAFRHDRKRPVELTK